VHSSSQACGSPHGRGAHQPRHGSASISSTSFARYPFFSSTDATTRQPAAGRRQGTHPAIRKEGQFARWSYTTSPSSPSPSINSRLDTVMHSLHRQPTAGTRGSAGQLSGPGGWSADVSACCPPFAPSPKAAKNASHSPSQLQPQPGAIHTTHAVSCASQAAQNTHPMPLCVPRRSRMRSPS
jgi:hypothetical protein